MNKHDIRIIEELWNKEKAKSLVEYKQTEINIRSTYGKCNSIMFCLNCIVISKYIEGERHTITIQNWRNLTFEDFINKVMETRWKKVYDPMLQCDRS